MASIVTRVLLALALLLAAAGPARAGEPAVAPAEMARTLDDAVALAAFLGGDAALARDPVVAADLGLGWAVTRRGLEALVRSNGYVGGLTGQPVPPVDLAALEADVAAKFAGMPRDQKELFVFAERRAAALRGLVGAMAPPQRAGSVARLRSQAPTPDKVPLAARVAENKALLLSVTARLDRANATMARIVGEGGALSVLQSPAGRP